MKRGEAEDDKLRSEYDLAGAVQGKHHGAYSQGAIAEFLDAAGDQGPLTLYGQGTATTAVDTIRRRTRTLKEPGD